MKRFFTFVCCICSAVMSGYASAPSNVEMVDLGLPSGTLWANMNVGATSPEETGSYFAWGETSAKSIYTQENYTGTAASDAMLSDNEDAAYSNWGSDWCMPTQEQFKELWDFTSHEWMNVNGHEGFKFTGENGKSVFLPATGFTRDNSWWNSSRLHYRFKDSNCCTNLHSSSTNYDTDYWDCRDLGGFAVRPVKNRSFVNIIQNGISYKAYENGVATLTSGNSVSGDITIPSTLTYKGTTYTVTCIGKKAFEQLGVTSVTIPNTVKLIGDNAFYGTSLTSLELPESVEMLGDWTFGRCYSLETATLDDNIRYVGVNCFDHCSSLTSVKLSAKMTSIPEGFLYSCSKLASVDIPSSVTTLGSQAFSCCNALTSIEIPESVVSISYGCFRSCENLSSVTIPGSIEDIGDGVFMDCNNLKTPIYTNTIFMYLPKSYSGGFRIPEGLTSVVGNAFQNCTNLTDITIPSSITSFSSYALQGCTNLSSIHVNSGNKYYTAVDGVLFNKEKTEIIKCPVTKSGTYEIPNTVTSIANYCFQNCQNLTSVTIPEGVTGLDHGVFQDCTGLTSLTLPNGLYGIDFEALRGCSSLKTLVLPSTFSNCYNSAGNLDAMTDITCYGLTPANIGTQQMTLPADCKLHVYKGLKDTYTNAGGLWATLDIVDDIEPMSGDVNLDTKVTVTDAAIAVNLSLGNTPDNILASAADMDGDGSYTVTDVNGIVDIILNGTSNSAKATTKPEPLSTNIMLSDNAMPAGADKYITLSLENSEKFCSMQFDITLPEGLTLVSDDDVYDVLSVDDSHSIATADITGGAKRVVCYSFGNNAFSDLTGNVVRLHLRAADNFNAEGAAITLTGIEAADGKMQKACIASKTFTLCNQATGIEQMESGTRNIDDSPCYNLNGQRVSGNIKGMYIKNGRKVIKF